MVEVVVTEEEGVVVEALDPTKVPDGTMVLGDVLPSAFRDARRG